MRNPLPVLAAALLTAAGAVAGDLPAWKPVEEPYSAWRYVDFTDAAGTHHTLYCRWSQCGAKVKTGTAPLYVLEEAGRQSYTASEPYHPQYAETYAGKTWEWLKGKTQNVEFQSTKTTFKSEVSRFVLDMSADPNKAVVKGTDVAIPVEPEHAAVSPTGWLFIVLSPVSVADDAPKPVSPKQPIPKPKPKPAEPKSPATTQPAPKPGAHKAPDLSFLERHWMIPTERTAYEDSVTAAKGAHAALQAAYKKGRETVATNLRKELQSQYNAYVSDGKFDQIDGYLTGKNYSGFEIMLRPEEYEALKKVLRTADSHADFTQPNAAAQYDQEMKPILGPEGNKPKIDEHLLAHRITEKFRGMLPPKPGAPPTVDPYAPLTDADFNRITDKAQRDDLRKQYDADWAKADTNDKKAAVNKDYRARIDKLVAAQPPAAPPSSFDPSKITSLEKLKALPREDRIKFCSGMTSDAGALGQCGDILANADAATTKCMAAKGADATSTAKAQNDCMAKVNACKASAGAAAPRRTSMADLPKDMQAFCANLLLGQNGPPPTIGTGAGGSLTVASPCPPGSKAKPQSDDAKAKDPTVEKGDDVDGCAKVDKPGPDPNFYTNLGNGLSFGVGGLLLASFFGGPALMLAVGLAAGVGGYYWSKSITEPKKDKDKDKK